jgi:hypothetical protein
VGRKRRLFNLAEGVYVDYRTARRIARYSEAGFAPTVVYDWQTTGYVVFVYGLDWCGTVAAGQRHGHCAGSSNGETSLVRWMDFDGDDSRRGD